MRHQSSQRQNRDFAAAVRAIGKPVELIEAANYNHFEMVESLGNPYGPNGLAALAMINHSSPDWRDKQGPTMTAMALGRVETLGRTMEVERLSSNLRKMRGSFAGSCKSPVPRAYDSPQLTAFLGFDTPRVMGRRKKIPAGTAYLLPLSPQERTSSGAAANSQLCAEGDQVGPQIVSGLVPFGSV
jgi:hypothetical protein